MQPGLDFLIATRFRNGEEKMMLIKSNGIQFVKRTTGRRDTVQIDDDKYSDGSRASLQE